MTGTKFKVAICGGGLGGMTLAVVLSRIPDLEVEIFEAAKEFLEIGAGFVFWPRVLKLLRKLGPDFANDIESIDEEYVHTEDFVDAIRYRNSAIVPEGVDLFTLRTKGHPMNLHRAEFHRVMKSHLSPSCKMHRSKRLVSYTQPESPDTSPITLNFADGSSATCDVLVGADGVKSAVRRCMMPEIAQTLSGEAAEYALSCSEPVYSGLHVYRSLIDGDKFRACAPPEHRINHSVSLNMYLGNDTTFLAYSISNGKYINFVGFNLDKELTRTCYDRDTAGNRGYDGPWVGDLTKEEFCKPYRGLEKETEPILECIEKGTAWAVYVTKCLPKQYHGRVTLIGDAAHAMVPFQATGAGQAVEDAFLLAAVLGHPSTTLETIPRALEVYDKIRREFSSDIAVRAMVSGRNTRYGWRAGDIPLEEFGESVSKEREWTWFSDMDDQLREAVEMLDSK